MEATTNPRLRFSLRQLFGWVLAAAIVLAVGRYLWLAVDAAREAARRSDVAGQAKGIVLALHLFNDNVGRLPPAISTIPSSPGRIEFRAGEPPLHSWRYIVYPYLQSPQLFDYSKPWNDPQYAQISRLKNYYYCNDKPGNLNTKFVAITGPDTAWGDGTEPPKSIFDLPDDLIVIVETRNSGLHWMEPGDLDLRTMPRTINAPDGRGISGTTRGGAWVATADGSVHWIPNDTQFEDLEPFFTIQSAEANDINSTLSN